MRWASFGAPQLLHVEMVLPLINLWVRARSRRAALCLLLGTGMAESPFFYPTVNRCGIYL